jgi:hypothetical protein
MEKNGSKQSKQPHTLFLEICNKYEAELSAQQKRLNKKVNPLRVFRHPWKSLQNLLQASRTVRKISWLEKLPINPMLIYLELYTTAELRAAKNLADLNLRLHGYWLSDSPIFKIAVIIGAIYAFFKWALSALIGKNTYIELQNSIVNHPIYQNDFVQSQVFVMKFVLTVSLFLIPIIFLWYLVAIRFQEIQRARSVSIILDLALEAKNISHGDS